MLDIVKYAKMYYKGCTEIKVSLKIAMMSKFYCIIYMKCPFSCKRSHSKKKKTCMKTKFENFYFTFPNVINIFYSRTTQFQAVRLNKIKE